VFGGGVVVVSVFVVVVVLLLCDQVTVFFFWNSELFLNIQKKGGKSLLPAPAPGLFFFFPVRFILKQ